MAFAISIARFLQAQVSRLIVPARSKAATAASMNWATLVAGHAGFANRLDPVVFRPAPIFLLLTRYSWSMT